MRLTEAGWTRWFMYEAWTLSPRGGSARVFTLDGPITTVGRDPSAGLVLEHDSVSRMHARFDREDERLSVTDLKSGHGTTLNGDPVLRAFVQSGDTVSFGDVAFRVDRRVVPAWGRIAALAGTMLTLAALLWSVLLRARSTPITP